ncbi:MAG: hypothetical protein ACM3N9_00010 [Syntrophothermus sp.]
MKKIILKVFSLVLCLFFITETAGVILFEHTCYSSHSREISAFSGKQSCCCSDEGSNAGETGYHGKCCRDQQFYIKADFSGFPVFLKKIQPLIAQIFFVTPGFNTIDIDTFPVVHQPWLAHSPPLTGKEFLIYAHQLRIPSPVC